MKFKKLHYKRCHQLLLYPVLFISVSAKGFYKSQPVIDFFCEILDINHQYLGDRRLQIDKEKFKKAISGKLVFFHCTSKGMK